MGNQLLTGGTVASGQSILSSPGCTVIEAASFADTKSVALAIAVGVNEGAGFTDSNIGVKSIPVSVAEQVNLTDTDTGVIQTVFLKAVAEGSNFTDTKTEIITGGGSSIAQQLAALNVGEWFMYPNSHATTVDPCPANGCSYSGTSHFTAIMDAWCGGAYDTTRDELLIHGGGHVDYGGNEVIAFSIYNGTWRRRSNPSSPVGNNSAYYPDGRPSATHSYGGLHYLPAPYDKMYRSFGSAYPSGGSTNDVNSFDLSVDGLTVNPWANLASLPVPPGDFSAGAANPTTMRIWHQAAVSSNATLCEYNPATNTWTTHGQFSTYEYATWAIDDDNNHMVGLLQDGRIMFWNLNSPTSVTQLTTTNNPNLASTDQAPGFVYDKVNKCFLGWGGGSTIWQLSIPAGGGPSGTWAWTQLALSAGNSVTPTDNNSRGTYGRFRYVPSLHAVVVVNSVNENVYIRKLPRDIVSGVITP